MYRISSLSEVEWLHLWEYAFGRPPYQQAVILLTTGLCEVTADAVWDMPLGARDWWLLQVRRSWQGSDAMPVVGPCPMCGDAFEVEMLTSELLRMRPAELCCELAIDWKDWQVTCRLPTSRDLCGMESLDEKRYSQELLNRCLCRAIRLGQDCEARDLSDDIRAQVMERMEAADPLADVQLDLECPQCGHQWRAALDIISYLWRELDHWAKRLLLDIHQLANAYGWSEADCLALGNWRRQVYLQMVTA